MSLGGHRGGSTRHTRSPTEEEVERAGTGTKVCTGTTASTLFIPYVEHQTILAPRVQSEL